MRKVLEGTGRVAVETDQMPPVVRACINSLVGAKTICDVTPITEGFRMIKSGKELQLARHAGYVAMAMMEKGYETIAEGGREYEVALAVSAAGTRKAAELLETHYDDPRMSPNILFLQIMATGRDTAMPHHRVSLRMFKCGEPVFFCLCGMTNFHRFKLGFDRKFWIGEVADKSQEEVYWLAVESQSAALTMIRPGVRAQELHEVYAEVIRSAGYEYPCRCGRVTGFSFLEKPELVFGDKTVLKLGMVFAVDGSVNIAKTFHAQVGDSFIVTEDGYVPLIEFGKDLEDVVIT